MTFLKDIRSPDDLKLLSFGELNQLAQEIRERIIAVLSVNGGHLASNLGSVELMIAMHYVFSSPQDIFIFDVSHQTYTHKLLTNRNDYRFEKIRTVNGLSGFSNPKESVHDHFYSGHAGTALSLSLGMARERDLSGGPNHIIPFIGDGSLTCGLSLEALNNLPRNLGRFIVVLNDNEMSISRNVGSITNILSRLLSNPTTSKWSRELESLFSKIPMCGSSLAKHGFKLTESVKNLVSEAPFFEQFGLSYIGPVDGHDLRKLITVFQSVKDLDLPIIVHAYTKKGYGVEKAEQDPMSYHGARPFDPITCEFLPSNTMQSTFPKIFGKHVLKMGEKNDKLLVVTPAMSVGSCLEAFAEKFPKRFFDVGIAEGHAVTFSGGLGKTGNLNVFCSIYSTFLQRALDNLFHDVCLQNTPIFFAVDRAGFSPSDGVTHHGIYDISFLVTMPNLVVCQPRNGHLLRELMESSLLWNRPAVMRYPNLPTEDNELPVRYRPMGRAEILSQGEELLIIALGHHCNTALTVRDLLKPLGIHATVVDPIFIKPLDSELIGNLLLTHDKIVTIEEHSLKGGLGSEINNFIISHDFRQVECLNFGIPEAFIDHGTYASLLQEIGLTPEKIVKKIVTHFSLICYAEQNS